MPVKSNRNVNSNKINLYNNNVKTYTGYYSNNWTLSTSASSLSLTGIATTEDGFIIIIANGTTFNYSDNGGITWSATTVPTGNWQCITYSKDLQRFIVVQNGGTVLYSNVKKPTLTSHWNSSSAAGNLNWQKVVAGANLLVAVSSTGANQFLYRRLMVSTDGINWRIESPPKEFFEINQTNTWISLAYGNGTYVAISNGSTNTRLSRIIYSENDANTWHSAKNSSSTNVVIANIPWSDIAYSSKLNLFIAVAVSGGADTYRLAYSEDGSSWSIDGVSSFVHGISWSSIVWSQELEIFIVIENVSTNQRIMTSNDGKNWTLRTFDINKIISGIIWNKYHGNFIAVSSATAATNNVVITKPLGINSFLPEDQYYNKNNFNNFTYEDINDEAKDGIIEIYNAPWGISPKIEYNVNNVYSINEPFPVNSKLSLNNKNGVIRSSGGSTIINQTIERTITVINLGTGKTLNSNLRIKFIPGDVTLVPGDFYYQDTSNVLTLDLSRSNAISLSPTVLIVKPYVFRFAENNSFNGLQLNGDTGVISGSVPYNSSPQISADLFVYSSIFEEEERITLTLNIERRYKISYGRTSIALEKSFIEEVNRAIDLAGYVIGGLFGGALIVWNNDVQRRIVKFAYEANIIGYISGSINYHFFIDDGYSLEGIPMGQVGSISVNNFKDYLLRAVIISIEKIPVVPSNNKKREGQQYLQYIGEQNVIFVYFEGDITNPFNSITFVGKGINWTFNISDFKRRWIPGENVTVYYYRTTPYFFSFIERYEIEDGVPKPIWQTIETASAVKRTFEMIQELSELNIIFK